MQRDGSRQGGNGAGDGNAELLLPGLANGNGKTDERLDAVECALRQQAERLTRIEPTLSCGAGGIEAGV